MKAAIRDHWWVLAAAIVVAASVAFIGLSGRTGEYVSTGVYLVRPTSTSDEDVVRATLGLTDAAKVEATYAFVIESDRVLDRARARVIAAGQGDDALQLEAVQVDAATVPGADMVTISASSRDAELAYRMATAVGEEAADYVASVDALFSLVPLDEPAVPTAPERFENELLLLVVAVVAGLATGGLIVFVLDRTWGRFRRLDAGFGDLDTDQAEYTRRRLLEEISRTDTTGVPFRVAFVEDGAAPGLVELDRPRARPFERKVIEAVGPTLRRYQHVGTCAGGGRECVAAILPQTSGDELEQLIAQWQTALDPPRRRPGGRTPRTVILECRYEDGTFVGAPAAVRAAEQLVR